MKFLDSNFYKECEGCYKIEKYSDINYVKPYMDGNNLMGPQWLCDVCLGKFLESYIEYRRYEK